jgi:SAM-dependent methyltransferase
MAYSDAPLPAVRCRICGYEPADPDPKEFGSIRGNTQRFCNALFRLWKCPRCLTLYSLDPVDYADIYADYPLNRRQMDHFARRSMANILRRLKRAGLGKTDKILDYGCGNGLFIRFLNEAGYPNVAGYDPYLPSYARLPAEQAPFDCVVNNDTVEHVDDPRGMIQQCKDLLRPGGLFYLGTADSEPVDLKNLEPEVMRLHQPYHRVLFTQETLKRLGTEAGFELVRAYRRSYFDTLTPPVNYRFLDELNKAVDNTLERALDPKDATRAILRTPRMWFFALFGYFFPTAYEPAVILRKPG